MEKEFLKSVLETPSCSYFETMMADFIKIFCIENGIQCSINNNNVYLVKGNLSPKESYPCFTAHLDTVHHKQIPYVVRYESLPITESVADDGNTVFTCEKIGIGGDDKCGIAIILHIMKNIEKGKAVFFWGEEIGGKGSKEDVNLNFFEDVGYIVGFDSPEFNRAAYECQGNKLFPYTFYLNAIKSVCDKYGITNFKSEPGTDVMILREKVSVVAMNFGSGYYNEHTETEYVVYEEVAKAADFGIELAQTLGNNKYKFRKHKPFLSYLKWHIKYMLEDFKEGNF